MTNFEHGEAVASCPSCQTEIAFTEEHEPKIEITFLCEKCNRRIKVKAQYKVVDVLEVETE